MKNRLAFEFVLLAALWGASFLFMRLGAAEFGPWATAGVRVMLAALALLPVLWLRGQMPALQRNAGRILFAGLLNSALPFALFSYAVLSISTGLSAILNATVPLFGAVVAWLWFQEKSTGSRVLGLVLGFVGVALLSAGKANFKPGGTGWAVLACLAATLSYAIAANYAKRYLKGIPSLAVATGSQIGAALGLAIPTIWFWPAQAPSANAWLAIITLAVLGTAVAYILYFRLIEHTGPAKAVTVTFVVPLFALLYGVVFLDETITPRMVGYGLLILCGTALSTGVVKWGPRKITPAATPSDS